MLVRTGRPQEALPILETLRAKYGDLSIRTEMIAVQAYRETNRPGDAAIAAERADRAREHDRISNPLDLLDPIRERYGLNAELKRGEEFDGAGWRSEAAAVFDRVLADTPIDFLELIMQTGARLDLLNHAPEKAIAKFELLATRMDVAPESKLVWGTALAETERLKDALQQWKRAIAAQPSAQLHFALARGLESTGDPGGAEQQRRAGRMQQAVDAYRADQLDAASRELTLLRTAMSENPRYYYYLGLVSNALGKRDQALKAYSRCLQLEPHHGFASDRMQFLTPGAQ